MPCLLLQSLGFPPGLKGIAEAPNGASLETFPNPVKLVQAVGTQPHVEAKEKKKSYTPSQPKRAYTLRVPLSGITSHPARRQKEVN